MFILSLADTTPATLLTPWGKEDGIRYLNKTFAPTQKYKTLDEAIAACRHNLDIGMFSLVIKDAEQYGVWTPLPEQLQIKLQPLVQPLPKQKHLSYKFS